MTGSGCGHASSTPHTPSPGRCNEAGAAAAVWNLVAAAQPACNCHLTSLPHLGFLVQGLEGLLGPTTLRLYLPESLLSRRQASSRASVQVAGRHASGHGNSRQACKLVWQECTSCGSSRQVRVAACYCLLQPPAAPVEGKACGGRPLSPGRHGAVALGWVGQLAASGGRTG